MPPSEFKENAESLNTAESVQVDVNPSLTKTELDAFASLLEVEIPGTWARSERNALIAAYITAARRLFAEVESRGRAIEALSARLTAKNTELDKVIREAAADKAKAEELARENRVLRLEPSNARFDEVVAEKNQAIDDWYEAAKERDELACKVEAIRRTINPRNPGWKPLSERYPEYFEPDSTEEAARKKGWRQGVDLLTQRIRAALVDPASAPEMPRPPAQERAGDTNTSGTGSGRGTGGAEAQGAQADLSLIPADLITSEPGIRGGEPCIDGTRIPASEVAGYLADGATWDEVREMLPSLPSLPVPSTERPTP